MSKIYGKSAQCPRCGQDENFQHVIACSDEDATTLRETHIAKAISLLQKNISASAASATKQYLLAWREGTEISNRLYIPTDLKSLFSDQSELGWEAFCYGRVSTSWQKHTTSVDSHNNPKRWVHALVTKLCQTIWHMWDHRNSILHDPAGRVCTTEHSQLNAQIRLQYWIGSLDLHPTDEKLFRKPMESICNKSIERKTLWLQDVRKARSERVIQQPIPTRLASPTDTSTDNNTNKSTGITGWLLKANNQKHQ